MSFVGEDQSILETKIVSSDFVVEGDSKIVGAVFVKLLGSIHFGTSSFLLFGADGSSSFGFSNVEEVAFTRNCINCTRLGEGRSWRASFEKETAHRWSAGANKVNIEFLLLCLSCMAARSCCV